MAWLLLPLAVTLMGVNMVGATCSITTADSDVYIWKSPGFNESIPTSGLAGCESEQNLVCHPGMVGMSDLGMAHSEAIALMYGVTSPKPTLFVFDFFSLERKYKNKCKDYVGIFRPGDAGAHRICRPKWKKYIVPHANAKAEFISNDKVEYPGFVITVKQNLTSDCHMLLDLDAMNKTMGYLTSPRFPKRFPPMKVCEYWLKAPLGKTITLQIEFMKMRYSKGCYKSYVAVDKAGFTFEDSANVGRSCGRMRNAYNSTSNEMALAFYAGSRKAKGFKAKYTVV